jgi:hypothetical protein
MHDVWLGSSILHKGDAVCTDFKKCKVDPPMNDMLFDVLLEHKERN